LLNIPILGGSSHPSRELSGFTVTEGGTGRTVGLFDTSVTVPPPAGAT